MEMANEPKLRAAMAYIKLHPEEWDQTTWICQTTGCLAGITVMLEDETTVSGLFQEQYWGLPINSIERRAREILGLTSYQGWYLFNIILWCTTHDQFVSTRHGLRQDECRTRHPTYEEFEAHVSEVTGVKFKDGEEL